MTTITIPQALLKKKDLVLVSRKEYEKLLERSKFYRQLDRDVATSLQEYKQGRAIGPFRSIAALQKSLEG